MTALGDFQPGVRPCPSNRFAESTNGWVKPATRMATSEAYQRALKTAGIEFLEENGGGAGVRH